MRLFFAALLLVSLSFAPPADDEPPNYCRGDDLSHCLMLYDALTLKLSEAGTSMMASAASALDALSWLLGRLSLKLGDFAVNGTLYDKLRQAFLDGLASFMPEVIQTVSFGESGLLYLGIVLAGMLMILPFAMANGMRLVRPERVIMWGVIMAALFVSSTVGYDLLGYLERLRTTLIQTALGGGQSFQSMSAFVGKPFLATDAEASALDMNNLLALPQAFHERYLAAPEYEEYTVKIPPITANGLFESSENASARSLLALQSLLFAALGFGAAYIIAIFSIGFILLDVAALVLIVFFVAALPLGFFEFGANILMGLVERYVQIVALGLALAILLRLMSGVMQSMPSLTSAAALVEWVGLLIALGVAGNMLAGGAARLIGQSFTAFNDRMRLAFSGAGVAEGGGMSETLGRVGRVASGALTGALLGGGPTGALLGGGAALLGELGQGGAASAVRQAAQMPSGGNVFVENGAGNPQEAPVEPLYRPGASRAAQDAVHNLEPGR